MVFSKSNVEKNNFLIFRSADSSICVFAQLKTIEKKGNMSLYTWVQQLCYFFETGHAFTLFLRIVLLQATLKKGQINK